MKSIERQYLTFYAVLGEAKAAQMEDEVLMETLRRTHETAYAGVEASWTEIPGRIKVDHEIEVDAFELCDDDVLIEEMDGFAVFGIGFSSYNHVPLETVKLIRECVERAYAKAAETDGVSARFIRAERMNVLRVTETTAVDFENEAPAIE